MSGALLSATLPGSSERVHQLTSGVDDDKELKSKEPAHSRLASLRLVLEYSMSINALIAAHRKRSGVCIVEPIA